MSPTIFGTRADINDVKIPIIAITSIAGFLPHIVLKTENKIDPVAPPIHCAEPIVYNDFNFI